MADDPSERSADFAAMAPYWQKVDALLGGEAAMREAAETFLPRFPDESPSAYRLRTGAAKYTAIFQDICEALAARPFAAPVALSDTAPSELTTFAADVDGRGNTLHVFAAESFYAAVARGLDWILVDYPADVPVGATRAEERRRGARPYWVRYAAPDVLAVYTAMIGGREEVVHARLREPARERAGFSETTREQIRIFDRTATDAGWGPPTVALWQRIERNGQQEWVEVEEPRPITLDTIPLVPFLTGHRIGGSWQIEPPMRGAADLQVTHYRQESALEWAKVMTAFPMLAGNGVTPETGEDGAPKPVPVGPHRVVYAPDGGTWRWIEPSAESLRFLAEDVKQTARELRELGRQPLTAATGNLTVVTTAYAAQKGNSAVAAWALSLKDALERALDLTARWLRIEGGAEVRLDTDFDAGLGDDDGFAHVLALRERGEISRAAAIHEAKRRGLLDAHYDPEADLAALLGEIEEEDLPPPDPSGAEETEGTPPSEGAADAA